MSLRKQIAYIAVLVASAVLFAHAVVPHHHRVQDLAVCTEASLGEAARCHHLPADRVEGPAIVIAGESCVESACDCAGGVGCTPTLPFVLRDHAGTDCGSSDQFVAPYFLLAVTGILLPEPPTLASCTHGSLYPYTYSLYSEYVASCLPLRAPPVLA